jgi:hypothetical protein
MRMQRRVLFEESSVERSTADAVRDQLQRRLDSGDLQHEEAAQCLGLVPVGLDALLRRRWSFEQAFRVSEAIGIDFCRALEAAAQSAPAPPAE